ncbi:MAG: phage portal protein, partial [Thermoplasmata archaeon]|nr:phage portal protein [Thermoplasmata archaeon]
MFSKQLRGVYVKNYIVRSCIDSLSTDASKEGHLWERVEGEIDTPDQQARREQADALLRNPNPTMTEHDLIVANITDILIYGDSFTEATWNDLVEADNPQVTEGRVVGGFWPIDAADMYILPVGPTGRLPTPPLPSYEQRYTATSPIKFTTDEILHISEGNISGRLYGTPRLLSAIILLATQMESMKYNLKTFIGAKYPRSLVGVGDIGKDDLDRLVDDMEKHHELDPQGITFLNSKDLKSLPLIGTNRDMEFMGLQKFVERSVCAVFRVPPIKIGIAETGGAGIVVGHTQMQVYWDNVEQLQRQWAEQYN